MENNPYIGPRPYQRGEQRSFYGRNREARDLLALVKAERVVLFYAQSGAGKTSLLNAQIIPALEAEDFRVLPAARVGTDLPPGIDAKSVSNIFVFSVLMGLAGADIPAEMLLQHTLLSFLRAMEETRLLGEDGYLPILILDQFEEILTTQRDRWQDARGFFGQLQEALREMPSLGIVLAMREDHLAGLDPYAPLLPKRLRTRFRMELLGREGALEAIVKPALQAGCPFDSGVAERLVDDLSRIKIQRHGDAEESTLGPCIEPVQLQVVCSRLWENLPEQGDHLIQWEEVEQYGNIDRALIDFYENALNLAKALEPPQGPAVSERQLRRWFGEQLITPMQTRGLALRGECETAGLSNAAVDILERQHLIRADVRAGTRWYELVHDRLVQPILQSNHVWEAARQTPLRSAARRWQDANDPGILYRGKTLVDALTWTEAHPSDVEPYEREFLAASQQAEKIRNRMARLRMAGAVAAVLTILATIVAAWTAYQASLTARSKELAALSMRWRSINQEQSILLARMAVEEKDTIEAEMAFRQSIVDYYPSTVLKGTEADSPSVLAYSPDGRFLAAGMFNSQIRVWDTSTGDLVSVMGKQNGSRVWSIDYSPDGRRLAAGGEDETVRIWDISTGLPALVMTEHAGPIYSVAYSPDGRYIASGGQDGVLHVWDALIGAPAITLTGHTSDITSVGFSPNGRFLASGSSDKTIRVWGVSTAPDGRLQVSEEMTLTGHTLDVIFVAFSHDGEMVASSSWDKTIRLWDMETGNEVATLVGHTGNVNSLAFSPDDRFLISGSSDATVRIWDIAERGNETAAILTGHTSAIYSVAYSPDGNTLASGSFDQTIRVWDSRPRIEPMLATLVGHTESVRSLVYSPDGQFLASGSADGTARIWSVATGQTATTLTTDGTIYGLAYSLDGRYLVTCSDDAQARIWDTLTGTPVMTITGNVAAEDAAYSPNQGRYLALAWGDGTATVLDTATWATVHRLVGHTRAVYAIAYSPDGRYIATGSTDLTVRIWDMGASTSEVTLTAKAILPGHTHEVYNVAFSPDGQSLASASRDRTVRIWDLRTYTTTDILLGHTGFVFGVAYSPDGKHLATSSADQSVRIWDMARSPKTVAVLTGHTGSVTSLAYSPDGKFIATGSTDQTVRRYLARFEDLWDLTRRYVPRELTPEERFSLLGEKP